MFANEAMERSLAAETSSLTGGVANLAENSKTDWQQSLKGFSSQPDALARDLSALAILDKVNPSLTQRVGI